MKDAAGHGSNSHGAYLRPDGRSIIPSRPYRAGGGPLAHGGQPMSSNADAARALMSTLKSTQAPVHPAMFGRRDASAPTPKPAKHPVEIYKGNPL